ncbi:hypothetical protein Gogos_020923 [Gossypium gossypioides]|uniref:Uncharacterized protein n=1 Tax=Gossypium gossypioides TaxID=34282 RepID=A0A7J9D518_GOSGO|nr:hypothetical protein [Gossypium gossypioides]
MYVEEQERVDSLDVRSSYLYGSTVTFGRICNRRISSGELRGYFQMRSYIGMEILIGDWPSVNSRMGVMVIKRKLVRWPMHEIRLTE